MAESPGGVWAELVGQQRAVAVLSAAADAARGGQADGARHAMSHAWLITGPPGSGRSNAARAFAAALLCDDGGCGSCATCASTVSWAHPDVTLVRTEQLSILVAQVRDLVMKAAMAPAVGRFQVIVIEDADRITDQAADALLKTLEEPPARTIWVLCAPTADDVIVTVRSRVRQVNLRTPVDWEVAKLLTERDGVKPEIAAQAARAAQGHIGRARALGRSEKARADRQRVTAIPGSLTSIGACLRVAAEMVELADEDAKQRIGEINSREMSELKEALGYGTKGTRPKQANAAVKELEEQQKARVKRVQRDALDRVLTELTTWYRDVLTIQLGAVDARDISSLEGLGLINIEMAEHIARQAEKSTAEQTLRRVDAILDTRQALEHSVSPLLAMEALMLNLA